MEGAFVVGVFFQALMINSRREGFAGFSPPQGDDDGGRRKGSSANRVDMTIRWPPSGTARMRIEPEAFATV